MSPSAYFFLPFFGSGLQSSLGQVTSQVAPLAHSVSHWPFLPVQSMLQLDPAAQTLLHQPPVHFMLQVAPGWQMILQLPASQPASVHLLSFSHFMSQPPPLQSSSQVSPDLHLYRQAPCGQSFAGALEAVGLSDSPSLLAFESDEPSDDFASDAEPVASELAALAFAVVSPALGVESGGGDP